MQPSLPASPASQVPPPVPDPRLPRFSNGAAGAAVLALLPLAAVGTMIAMSVAGALDDDVAAIMMGVSSAAAFLGCFWAVITVVRLSKASLEDRPRGRWLAVLAIPVALLSSMFGAILTLLASADFSRGRQLRQRGRPIFAALRERGAREGGGDGEGWLDLEDGAPVPVPAAERAAIAAAWRDNGKTEHASVAAFAKLAAQLVALGAPPRMVEDAHRDALDEIRHARLCFSLAHAVDGRPLEPGALSAASAPSLRFSRTAALAQLAVESLVDGALNEGVSARTVAKLARGVDDERVRSVLLAIARDEGRHAAHGWHVLEWCVREGGDAVAAAVRGALAALPKSMGRSLVDDADDGRWQAFGLPGRALMERSHAEVRAALVARASALVSPRAEAAAAA